MLSDWGITRNCNWVNEITTNTFRFARVTKYASIVPIQVAYCKYSLIYLLLVMCYLMTKLVIY